MFQKSVIQNYLKNLDQERVAEAYTLFQSYFGDKARIKNIKLLKEESYQEGFLREFFVQVLGYTINPDTNYNLTTEYKNQTDSKKADGAILQNGSAIGVIELKSTKTKNLESIKEQAFSYKNNQPDCVYVITSNFRKIRLYIDHAIEFIEWDLFDVSEDNFKVLYLLLNQENICKSLPLKIRQDSKLKEKEISAKFYKDYNTFKNSIFENLTKNNPSHDQLTLFKKSQKFIDRLLFTFFAEDTGLIPPNIISEIIGQWEQLQDLAAYQPLYDRFKLFFNHINTGYKYPKYEIPPYNGGLFAPDEVLDNVRVDDKILKDDSLKLSSYDFSTDVDINILGHIFENSLSELEEITAELEGKPLDKKTSKRKKDGIFYTPKYITQYIVENTIGKACKEKKEEFGINEIDIDGTYFKKSKKSTVSLSQKGKKAHQQLQSYKDWLLSLKILDPACGSGAFLNQALLFLIVEHENIRNLETKLAGGQLSLFEIDITILENNLYGVDINEESVEIAKLSLWLRTAKRNRKLSDLNKNIKYGNSLINDPQVAGQKAFNWETAFQEIMSSGGFDFIIGNPPYGDFFSNNEKEYILNKYEKSFSGTFDIYIPFFEIALNILKKEGMIGFITPHTFIEYSQFNNLRRLLLDNSNIYQLIKLTNVFDDPIVDNIVITLSKSQKKNDTFKGAIYKETIDTINHSSLTDIPYNNLNYESFSIKQPTKVNINKLSKGSSNLGDILKITQGITTGGNNFFIKRIEEFRKNNVPNKLLHKVLKGKSINKYSIQHDETYILYSNKTMNEQEGEIVSQYLSPFKEELSRKRETKQGKLPWFCIHWARNENDFNEPKILIRQTASEIIGVLDTENFYPIDSIHTLNLKNHNENLEKKLQYILGILNSSLFSWLYKWKLDEKGKVYPQIKKVNIEWMPIKNYKENEEISCSVAEIQSICNELEKLKNKFIHIVDLKYKINSKKISINEIDYINFKKILKPNKINLTLSEEADWAEYIESLRKKTSPITDRIAELNHKIDSMVYKLYELTEEEIKIVEGVIEN